MKEIIEMLREGLKKEIEAASSVKGVKLRNLIRREGGLYVCTSPLKIEGEGIMKVNGEDISVSIQCSNNIIAISGMEDCLAESFQELQFFQDNKALLQKIADEFEAYKPNPLATDLFAERSQSMQSMQINEPELNGIEHLYDAQKRIVKRSLTEKYLLVVGPAGTGKTATIVATIKQFMRQGQRVLISSHANLAVEGVFAALTKECDYAQDDLLVSFRTDLESLDRFTPKSISEEKSKAIRDELEILEPALLKLATLKRELLAKIEPADDFIEKNETLINLTIRDLNNCNIVLQGQSNELESLQRRLNNISSNTFLATLSHLITSDKKDEIEAQIALTKKAIDNKRDEIQTLQEKIQSFKEDSENKKAEVLDAKEKLLTVNVEGKACKERVAELKTQLTETIGQNLYKNAKVAGCTLMSAATNKKVKEAGFDVIIIDEASMANLPTLLLAMNCATKVIMFGDPMQLRPVARVAVLKQSIFDVLGITEAFRNGEIHPKADMLDTQFRCHPEIATLTSSLFYGGRLKNGRIVSDSKKALFIKNTSGLSSTMKFEGGSFVNERHQKIVIDQVRNALSKGQRSIGVMSPFKAQAQAIQNLFDMELKDSYPDAQFKASTIHSFQGQEMDVVIFDVTFGMNSKNALPLMFVGDMRSEAAELLNVATTRARDFFVLVCDLHYTHKCADALVNAKDQALVQWLKAIEELAFQKN